MVSSQWRIGLELQNNGLRAVGLQYRRQGWRLCRWWHLPFSAPCSDYASPGFARQAVAVLSHWRKTLPYRYQLRVSIPALRTLQQQVVVPDRPLGEAQLQRYIEQAASAQLALAGEPLAWDYPEPATGPLAVTGVRQSDIQLLSGVLRGARLVARSITPDASALLSFARQGAASHQWLVHREPDYWLWAGDGAWGSDPGQDPGWFTAWCQRRGVDPHRVAFSSSLPEDAGQATFSPWSAIPGLSPPLPACAGLFTVATGLALGSLP